MIGMAIHKTDDFVAIIASIVDYKQNQLSFFFAVFSSLVVVTAHSRAYNYRCGDFCADNNNDRVTNQSLYPLHMRAGKKAGEGKWK